VLSEVEHVCDRVGIIRSGRLVQLSGLDELHHIRVHQVEIEFEGGPPALEGVAGVDHVETAEGRLTCTVRGSFEPLLQALAGVHVVNLVSHEPSLEDVFLTYYREKPALPAPAR
jgi:ABC-2 type transport system ATP-binding protein